MSFRAQLEALALELADEPPTTCEASPVALGAEGTAEPCVQAAGATTSCKVVSLCPQEPEAAMEWIARACPLLSEDKRYVRGCLERVASQEVGSVCDGFLAAWQTAADQEAASHRKANAGRRAANIWLRIRCC